MTKPMLIGALLAGVAGTAQADVTAREVWDDWVAALDGGEVAFSTASIDEADGRLTITDLTMTSELEEGSYSVSVDEIVLAETDDGTVTVTLSPSFPITLEGLDSDGAPTSLTFRIDQPGFTLVVSDVDAGRRHAYQAPEISVTLAEATQAGEPMDLETAATITDATGSYVVSDDDAQQFDSEFDAASARLETRGSDPEQGPFEIVLEVADLSGEGLTSFLDRDIADMSAALRDGFESEGSLGYGETSYTVTGENEDGAFGITGGAEAGELTARIARNGLVYGSRNTGSRIVVTGDQIPVPEIVLEMAESEGVVTLPVLAGDEPQEYGLLLRLVDLTMSEDIWSMFDPAGVMPREPANVLLDLSGTATLEQDLMGGGSGTEEAPGTVDTLSLDALRIALLGVDLTGSGTLEFVPPPEDPEEGGTPRPVGTIDLQLVGAQALIDRLVRIGAIPEDQAVGARMMLGVFARPADADDTLTSTFEFGADGSVSANGQRVR